MEYFRKSLPIADGNKIKIKCDGLEFRYGGKSYGLDEDWELEVKDKMYYGVNVRLYGFIADGKVRLFVMSGNCVDFPVPFICFGGFTVCGDSVLGYKTGEIIKESIWDEQHRDDQEPEGKFYMSERDVWCLIYSKEKKAETTVVMKIDESIPFTYSPFGSYGERVNQVSSGSVKM